MEFRGGFSEEIVGVDAGGVNGALWADVEPCGVRRDGGGELESYKGGIY